MVVSSAEFDRDGWGIESTGNMMNSALMLSKNHQFYAAKNGIFTRGHGCSPAMNSTKNQKAFAFLVCICLLHPNFSPFPSCLSLDRSGSNTPGSTKGIGGYDML